MGYILTVTLNASIDTTLTIPSALKVGETNRVSEVLKLPGGKGLNVARVLHTLDVPVHATGLVGTTALEFISNGLAQDDIPSTFEPFSGSSRTCTAVVEYPEHRVTEINEPGPFISEIQAQAFLELYEALLPDALAVVLSGSLPPGLPTDYYALLLNQAHAMGIPALLDTSGEALRQGIEAGPLLVKPNASEVKQFLGKEVHSVEDAVYAGQRMRAQGAQMAAITLGAEGAILVSKMGTWLARLSIPNAISGVGSGDAFVAGFIAGLHKAVEAGQGASIAEAAATASRAEQALRLAAACGAANTLLLGAGVLRREDVERFKHMTEILPLGG
jgi:1-phosphofructokinase family hexose kinase